MMYLNKTSSRVAVATGDRCTEGWERKEVPWLIHSHWEYVSVSVQPTVPHGMKRDGTGKAKSDVWILLRSHTH